MDARPEHNNVNYKPAPYLVEASLLTEEQLKRCFSDFVHSLEYITAPPLVFERVVANIVNSLKANTNAGGEAASPPSPQTDLPIARRAPPAAPAVRTPFVFLAGAASATATHGRALPATPKIRTPSTGSFHTASVTPHDAATGATALTTFSPPYPTPPGIVTGLRLISISGTGTLRALTHARNITPTDFTIHAVNHCATTRFAACASWLEFAPDDADFQHGAFSTTQDHPAMEKKRETVRRIVFPRAYASPPQVVAWLSGFQSERRANVKVLVWAQGVTATGFDLYVTSGLESILFTAEVAWAACSAQRPETAMGTFQTAVPLQRRETGFVGFEAGRFREEEPVKVFLAINRFAVNMGSDVNLRVSCAKVDKAGLSWYITTWDNAQVTFAGGAFIVLG